MGGTFVITLREGFEAALILGIVYTYSEDRRRAALSLRDPCGLFGVLASIALGVVVTALSGPLLDMGPDVIGLGVIFLAVVVLTWHGYWMRQHARAVKGDVQRKIDEARPRTACGSSA
jgi:high-affinity iron transporter